MQKLKTEKLRIAMMKLKEASIQKVCIHVHVHVYVHTVLVEG